MLSIWKTEAKVGRFFTGKRLIDYSVEASKFIKGSDERSIVNYCPYNGFPFNYNRRYRL